MQVTVTIHETWLTRPDELRRLLALLAALESPPPGTADRPVAQRHDPREDLEEPFDPTEPAPARRQPDRGDAWEPPDDDQDAPTNGRQLLGWAAKQVPDLKGALIGYGKKKGLRSKIVDWTPDQVADAYRYARAQQSRSHR
jgi:hypothetical protein